MNARNPSTENSHGFSLFNDTAPAKSYQTIVVSGGQFGDEGKGKVAHYLAKEADIVVRSQGGNNAGHTIIVNNTEFKMHLVPCGILEPGCQCYITGGVVIDPKVFIAEIEKLQQQGIATQGRVWISPSAHVILPYHCELDKLAEQAKGKDKIGTTGRGIGPCYSDKSNRVGIRVVDFIHPDRLKACLVRNLARINEQYKTSFCPQTMFQECLEQIEQLKPYVKESLETELNHAIDAGKKVLFEGAQGTFLDVSFGTVPYVTSSSTIASGIVAGAGVGPAKIKHCITVVKAYTTRVGEGPMPTEEKFLDNAAAREFGTTTGRPRRLGHFDAPLVKTANMINGATAMVLTKLDILDSKEKIKICVAYVAGNQRFEELPVGYADLTELEPVYEEMDGWLCSTGGVRHYQDLPPQAKAYIERIQSLCRTKVCMVSVGPDREATIVI